MAEQRTFNPLVQGSTPWRPTQRSSHFSRVHVHIWAWPTDTPAPARSLPSSHSSTISVYSSPSGPACSTVSGPAKFGQVLLPATR
jgi:hypothetical protein